MGCHGDSTGGRPASGGKLPLLALLLTTPPIALLGLVSGPDSLAARHGHGSDYLQRLPPGMFSSVRSWGGGFLRESVQSAPRDATELVSGGPKRLSGVRPTRLKSVAKDIVMRGVKRIQLAPDAHVQPTSSAPVFLSLMLSPCALAPLVSLLLGSGCTAVGYTLGGPGREAKILLTPPRTCYGGRPLLIPWPDAAHCSKSAADADFGASLCRGDSGPDLRRARYGLCRMRPQEARISTRLLPRACPSLCDRV